MGRRETDLVDAATSPDTSLQRFSHISAYARSGRMPWRRSLSHERIDLAVGERRDSAEKSSDTVIHVPRRFFEQNLKRRFQQELSHISVFGLLEKAPVLSAHRLLYGRQKTLLILLSVVLIALIIIAPLWMATAINLFVAMFFIIVMIFRIYLALIALRISPKEVAHAGAVADMDLPTVTILLPLYDEAAALPLLSASIDKLDYPPGKVDVKLLLEADDEATIAAARRLKLDFKYDLIVLPPSEPRTKPKACNHALYLARGDLIVIYDAEDMPEADQLRKAAAMFAQSDERVACVQARLNYYNANENLLTRLFALEYALWFDLLLPALEKIRAPIPLGGTSNFFRVAVLRDIGGWDPFNVTEDADLGMRLARFGYRTAMINSTTFEEANSKIGNWTRQRSRWMKGYLQTWLVHMREPLAFYRAASWRGFLSTQLFLAGTVFSALINPFLWGMFLFWVATGEPVWHPAFPQWLGVLNMVALFAGNATFIILAVIAPLKRGWTALCPYAVFTPFYWWMATFAAYKALWQLATRPHYWEKTNHILSGAAMDARAATLTRLHQNSAHSVCERDKV